MTYFPKATPILDNPEATRQYVEEELRRIALEFQETEVQNFRVLHVEPVKRVDGMVAFADGTNWNPGGGAGLYQRLGGAWVKL
jgi:hypothetical protein